MSVARAHESVAEPMEAGAKGQQSLLQSATPVEDVIREKVSWLFVF